MITKSPVDYCRRMATDPTCSSQDQYLHALELGEEACRQLQRRDQGFDRYLDYKFSGLAYVRGLLSAPLRWIGGIKK
jgi:hypothetical protein